MADGISVASGIVAISIFAGKSSIALFNTVKSFQNHKRDVRELKDQLETLTGTIQSVQDLAPKHEDTLEPLNLPLLRCGRACEEFSQMIASCTKHSNQTGTSFRDWTKLKYHNEDISGVKRKLGMYTDTMSIAIGVISMYAVSQALILPLADHTFRRRLNTVTKDVMVEFQERVTNAIADIQEQLGKIREDPYDLSKMAQEIESIEACQKICDSAKQCIETKEISIVEDVNIHKSVDAIITSCRDLISVKRVNIGEGSKVMIGYATEASQLARINNQGYCKDDQSNSALWPQNNHAS